MNEGKTPPTLEEILVLTEEIQDSWTEQQRSSREGHRFRDEPLEVKVVAHPKVLRKSLNSFS